MTDYNILTDKLKIKGIKFKNGLTETEINVIEKIYDFIFPESLRKIYSVAIPFSEDIDNAAGFPNWTDFSEVNIAKIKERIHAPLQRLYLDKSLCDMMTKTAAKAPLLIPLYSHRYMPTIDGMNAPPVISAVGRDIIYYGDNLYEYLQNEFLNECFIIPQNRPYIPFWSDIINRA